MTDGLSIPRGKSKGTYIAFATEPGNVALDGEGTRNSPFSAAFLKHVKSPGLEIASFMKKVRREVTIATKDKQIPWSNSGLIGDFYFNTDSKNTPDSVASPSKVDEQERLKRLALERQLAEREQAIADAERRIGRTGAIKGNSRAEEVT